MNNEAREAVRRLERAMKRTPMLKLVFKLTFYDGTEITVRGVRATREEGWRAIAEYGRGLVKAELVEVSPWEGE